MERRWWQKLVLPSFRCRCRMQSPRKKKINNMSINFFHFEMTSTCASYIIVRSGTKWIYPITSLFTLICCIGECLSTILWGIDRIRFPAIIPMSPQMSLSPKVSSVLRSVPMPQACRRSRSEVNGFAINDFIIYGCDMHNYNRTFLLNSIKVDRPL